MDIVKQKFQKLKNTIDSLINMNYDIKTFAVATEFDVSEWKIHKRSKNRIMD